MSTIKDAIRVATQDNVVTKEEWASLKPLANATPTEASEDARELVSMFANDQFSIDASAKSELRTLLRARGYDVPVSRPAGMDNAGFTEKIISSNVTETDNTFRTLQILAGREDAKVNVGVMDTGLDTKHTGLDTKLWTNEGEVEGDGVDNDGNGYVDDKHGFNFNTGKGLVEDAQGGSDLAEGWISEPGVGGPRLNDNNGHGTHVSGIITAGTDSVDVMGLAVIASGNYNGDMFREAVEYAAANGAKVLNMSYRVTDKATVASMIETMKAHPEILFVASAGNDGRDINSYNAEAYLKKNTLDNFAVISAGDQNGGKASYTNYGKPWATHADTGSDVLSSTPGGKYQAMSGTSMASPNAAGAAAKALVMDPDLTPVQLKSLLADATTPAAHWDPIVNSGGEIDSRAAYTIAAISGVARREGISVEAAAEKLQLSAADAEKFAPLAQKYL